METLIEVHISTPGLVSCGSQYASQISSGVGNEFWEEFIKIWADSGFVSYKILFVVMFIQNGAILGNSNAYISFNRYYATTRGQAAYFETFMYMWREMYC